jgi:hypothetical protein
MKKIHKINGNTYITSDEKIKVGDWFISKQGTVCNHFGWSYGDKKIILTTDPYLIDDGIDMIKSYEEEEPKQDYSGVHIRHCYQGEYEDDCPAKPLEPKQLTDLKIAVKLEEIEKEVCEQETLEEAALKEAQLSYFGDEVDAYVRGSVFGTKWQQERMYSDSDMTNYALYILHNDVITPKEWFKKFKKK